MYCLAAGSPRSEEHLIPRALGGVRTLRDAVCEPCRVLTGRLEQATLDREFAVPKTLLALACQPSNWLWVNTKRVPPNRNWLTILGEKVCVYVNPIPMFQTSS